MNITFEYLLSPSKIIPNSSKLKGNTEDIDFTVKQLASTIRLFSLRDLSNDELASRFSHLPHDLQRRAICTIHGRRDEVINAQLEDVNSRITPLMTYFDWNIRWILGGSSLPSYRAQIANLYLNCRQPDGSEKMVHTELKKSDVEMLIKLLESSDLN